MFGILLLLFTVVPAIEIYLLIKVGGIIGGLNTISIVLITGITGAILAKSQGLLILNKIQTELQKGSLPHEQLIHGFLVFGGGLLLLTPGFLTDFMGLSMVFPGTRHLIVKLAKNKFSQMIKSGNVQFYSFGQGGFSQTHNTFEAEFESKKTNDSENIIEVDFRHEDK